MKSSLYSLLTLLFVIPLCLNAQMQIDGQTLFGHEWIEQDQSYFKFQIDEDGLYQINYQQLINAGIPVDQIQGKQYQLFRMGQQVPLYLSNGEAPLSSGDFIFFWGEKNGAELDQFLFEDPDAEILNDQYSMYADEATYYLSWSDSSQENLRFTEIVSDNEAAQPSNWYWKEEMIVESRNHFQKRYLQNLVAYSIYDEGEGFASRRTNRHIYNLSGADFVAGQASPKLDIRLVSDRDNHHLQVELNGTQVLSDSLWRSYQLKDIAIDLPEEVMADNMQLRIEGILGVRDWFRIANIQLSYPANWRLDNLAYQGFRLATSVDEQLVSVEQANNGEDYFIINPRNNTWRNRTATDNNLQFSTQPQEAGSQFIIARTNSFQSISGLNEVQLESIDLPSINYLLITHSSLLESAQEYANYRQSAEGGSWNVGLVTIDKLYERHAYGVDNHPIAIRNFVNHLYESNQDLEYIFLLGKGIEYQFVRTLNELTALNLLPTFGSPGSDHLLVASPGETASLAAVGRVSARNNADARQYLEKIKDYEAQLRSDRTYDNFAWRKKMIHLVGGDVNEQPIFNSQMNFMEEQTQENKLSAEVVTNVKLSSEAVPTSVGDQIITRVNDGVIIKSFLGHGSIVVTGFGLDDPAIYSSASRYPLDFAFGCLTGNSFTGQISVGERFVITPKSTGSIGYIASSGYGYPYTLGRFGGLYYQLLGTTHYNEGIGSILNSVIDSLHIFPGAPNISLSQQLNLQGDPAVPLFIEDAPDYVFDFSSVRFSPSVVTTESDSLGIQFSMANIGSWSQDSLMIRAEHKVPDGSIIIYNFKIPFETSLIDYQFKIPLANKDQGIHNINLIADPENIIQEYAQGGENNNELSNPDNGATGIEFFMLEDGVDPLYPPNYGVVKEASPSLKAITKDIFTDEQFVFELDTLDNFSSPFKKSFTSPNKSALGEWTPNFSLDENKVYYWRVAISDEETNPEEILWREGSFLYAPESPLNWNQSHINQIDNGELSRLAIDSSSTRIDFDKVSLGVVLEAIARTNEDNGNSRLLLNNFRIQVGRANRSLIGVKVFDPVDGSQWVFPETNRNDNVFQVGLEDGRAVLLRLLEAAPEQSFITLFTFAPNSDAVTVYTDDWELDSIRYGTNLMEVLESQGAVSARLLKDYPRGPYAFVYQKNVGPIGEDLATDGRIRARVVFDLPTIWPSGSYISDWMGPAVDWQQLEWEFEKSAGDSVNVALYGQTAEGEVLRLRDNLSPSTSINFIDAAQYPFIRLQMELMDSLDRTAPQLKYIRARYTRPDNVRFVLQDFQADTLFRGQDLSLDYQVINFGGSPSDSIEVSYRLRDQANKIFSDLQDLAPVPAGESSDYNFKFNTLEMAGGAANLTISEDGTTESPQLVGARAFFLKDDRIPPSLDVTFDGRRIINRELITPEPVIRIELKDDNRFLLLNDTASFDVVLLDPNQVSRQINTTDADVIFTAATEADNNVATLEFTPQLSVDGIYKLVVNAKDNTGNEAGELAYEIEFEVINANQLSNLLPYPNPFSTQTRFVYTMTGSTPPDQFMLRIMTSSGRIVREITQDEFGELKVGTHQSDFVWDGTDEFGDRLANGVYLYRLIVKDQQNQDYEQYENGSVDSFFDKGFGKIVILR